MTNSNFIFNEEHSQDSKRMGNILETSSETEVNASANLKPRDPLGREGLYPR